MRHGNDILCHELWEVEVQYQTSYSWVPLSFICVKKSLNVFPDILLRDLNEEYINVDPEEYVLCVVKIIKINYTIDICTH